MDRTVYRKPPKWWAPKLSARWVRIWRPLRRIIQYRMMQLVDVEYAGLHHVTDAISRNEGILITPNHSSHTDAIVMYRAAEQVGMPFYFMSGWQVLGTVTWLRRKILQQHGCFSVDRDGTDMQAFRQAVNILKEKINPLVIFPEGEVYHINERVTPFREGPAAIALTASKKAQRPIACIPCGLRYQYTRDPMPELLPLMEKLERHVYWRPRPDLELHERIYRLAQAVLALKEIEFFGHAQNMELSERVTALSVAVLERWENTYAVDPSHRTIPERVKALRQAAIERMEESVESDEINQKAQRALDDLYVVAQLFSYPGDYVAENPSVERMAETLDKFEEDVLNLQPASVRGQRRAIVTFGEPIAVQRDGEKKMTVTSLTDTLEAAVQKLLDAT